MLFTRNTCNKWFATFEFQRDEKTVGIWNGDEIYLWYDETAKDWCLTPGSWFEGLGMVRRRIEARNNKRLMYFKTQGKQELLIHLQ